MKYVRVAVALPFFILITLLVASSAAANSLMFWAEFGSPQPSSNQIQRANLDGSNSQSLATPLQRPFGVALDPTTQKVYWTDFELGLIQRTGFNGGPVETVLSGLSSPFGLAIDSAAGLMYWTDDCTDKIQRANLDGSNVTDLVSAPNPSDARAIALDVVGNTMYWVDSGLSAIRRANLDGSGVANLITTALGDMRGIALDLAGGKLYWSNSLSDTNTKIQRADLDGNNIEDVLTVNLVGGLALDPLSQALYFTNPSDHRLYRVNLDGSGLQDLGSSGLASPAGIAILSEVVVPEPSSLVLLISGFGALLARSRFHRGLILPRTVGEMTHSGNAVQYFQSCVY